MSQTLRLLRLRAPLSLTQTRSFQSSIRLSSGKETKLHTDPESRKADVEAEKQDSLKSQQDGKGHWKEGLASDSESIIKADRNEATATEENIKKLQEETKKVAGK